MKDGENKFHGETKMMKQKTKKNKFIIEILGLSTISRQKEKTLNDT
jgi:hypothetical protein